MLSVRVCGGLKDVKHSADMSCHYDVKKSDLQLWVYIYIIKTLGGVTVTELHPRGTRLRLRVHKGGDWIGP